MNYGWGVPGPCQTSTGREEQDGSRPRCHFEAKREISLPLTGALPTAGLRSLPLVEMTAGEGRDDKVESGDDNGEGRDDKVEGGDDNGGRPR